MGDEVKSKDAPEALPKIRKPGNRRERVQTIHTKRRKGKRRATLLPPQVRSLTLANKKRKSINMRGREKKTLMMNCQQKIYLMKSVRRILKQMPSMTCLPRTFHPQHLIKENRPLYLRTRKTPTSWTTGTMQRDTIGLG